MKQIAAFPFHTQTRWSGLFSAPVYYKDGTIYYPYGTGRTLYCRKVPLRGTAEEVFRGVPAGRQCALPAEWNLFEYQEHVILSCGNQQPAKPAFPNRVVCDLFLDLDDGMKEISLPLPLRRAYACRVPTDETRDVILSDCILRYRNSRSYQCCTPDGRLLWTERHRGYRYTPVEERDGCLLFGTAGAGGGLYCYRESDGLCLCALDTKGSPRYCWCGGQIACKGREGQLLLVDPFCGAVRQSVAMEFPLTDNSGFYADDTYLCTVGFERKTNSPCLFLFDWTAG